MAPRNTLSADSAERQSSLGRSFTSSSPIAEAAIAHDLAQYDDDTENTDGTSGSSTVRPFSDHTETPHSLAGSYRRPSNFTTVNHTTIIPSSGDYQPLTHSERENAIEEERHLLSDNNVIGPEDAHGTPHGLQHKLSSLFSTPAQDGSSKQQKPLRSAGGRDADTEGEVTESTALLGGSGGNGMGPEEIDRKWEEAVTAGLINTTWRREAQVLGKYSLPLMVTFLLQYSLTVASIFTIGHLGKEELGAVSLASMTVSITGNAVYSGLATSLDTLCAQAYGSGKRKLVGLQMLRMVFFLWVVTIPIAVLWFFSEHILAKIVPERNVAKMAGLYLKIALLGTPGYACFESGKRYLQAQGVFSASLYVLIICAPLNAFMNWLFVWVGDVAGDTSTKLISICRNYNGDSLGLRSLWLSPRPSCRCACLCMPISVSGPSAGAASPSEPLRTGVQ